MAVFMQLIGIAILCYCNVYGSPGVTDMPYKIYNILGYVEHTRGEPSLRASVYIIAHHTVMSC